MNITYQDDDAERFQAKFEIPGWGKNYSDAYFYYTPDNAKASINFLVKRLNPKTILDYGCGQYGQSFKELVSVYPDIQVTYYDPFVEKFKQEPTGTFDIVVCYNVINTVRHKFITNVIEDFYNLSNRYVLLNIIQPERGFEQINLDGTTSGNFVFYDWDKMLEPYFTIKQKNISGLQKGFIPEEDPIKKLFWVLEKRPV